MATNEPEPEATPRLTHVQLAPPQLFATANEIDALDMWSDTGAYVASVWDVNPYGGDDDLYNNIGGDLFQECSGDDPDLFLHTRVAQDVPPETVCNICLDSITQEDEPQSIRKLMCDHWFHAKCIMPWLFKKQSCPTCRSKVSAMEW